MIAAAVIGGQFPQQVPVSDPERDLRIGQTVGRAHDAITLGILLVDHVVPRTILGLGAEDLESNG